MLQWVFWNLPAKFRKISKVLKALMHCCSGKYLSILPGDLLATSMQGYWDDYNANVAEQRFCGLRRRLPWRVSGDIAERPFGNLHARLLRCLYANVAEQCFCGLRRRLPWRVSGNIAERPFGSLSATVLRWLYAIVDRPCFYGLNARLHWQVFGNLAR